MRASSNIRRAHLVQRRLEGVIDDRRLLEGENHDLRRRARPRGRAGQPAAGPDAGWPPDPMPLTAIDPALKASSRSR
ncbi:MAG: hypothetical protein ACLT98_08230 [Eggerthellaceae bacterium]